jgi:cell division protein FtsI (penicillin-binding protein 3)
MLDAESVPRGGRGATANFVLRARCVLLLFGLGFAACLARAAQLQLLQHAHLKQLAQDQYVGNVKITARRGQIADRHGRALAISVDLPSIFADPRRIADAPRAASLLAPTLGMGRAELLAKLRSRRAFVWLKRQVEPAVHARVLALKLRGVGSTKEPKRFYPQRDVAAQVVGLAGMDARGLEGIEKFLDKELLGEQQRVQTMRDARGQAVLLGGLDPSQKAAGYDTRLTLDSQLQHSAQVAVQRAMVQSRAKAAAAIVLDVASAEVLAMAVVPSFDANAGNPSAAQRRNRLVTDMFEPGSTLKPYVVAAALDSGKVNAQSTFFCENGRYAIGRRSIGDTSPHGWMGLTQILAKSSNIGMAKISVAMGRQNLEAALRRGGLGQRSGIELPGETAGRLRHSAGWSDLETATIAFGQGLAVSGLQLAALYRVLAADGIYKEPRLVQELRHPDGSLAPRLPATPPPRPRRVLSARAVRQVVRMMEASVMPHEGTGRLAAVPGYRVAGKTGTAQKADPFSGGYSRTDYLALFAGFLPAEAPRVVILVAVDEPQSSHYGGVVAAPVFAQIGLAAMQRLGVPPTEPVAPAVPDPAALLAQARARAKQEAEAERLATLSTQPEALSVEMGEAPGRGRLPSFMGLSARQVVGRFNTLAATELSGWQLSVVGTGAVVRQDPPAGAPLQARGKDIAVAALRQLRLELAP